MVADLRHVVFSLLRLKLLKCENTKFLFLLLSILEAKKRKDEQKKNENTTLKKYVVYLHFICYISAFSRSKYKNAKTQGDEKV
jgi:hypothetical protein